MESVKHFGYSIEFAGTELQKDREIGLAALENNYVHESLKNDRSRIESSEK